jgi:hypothetical protein
MDRYRDRKMRGCGTTGMRPFSLIEVKRGSASMDEWKAVKQRGRETGNKVSTQGRGYKNKVMGTPARKGRRARKRNGLERRGHSITRAP